MREEKVTKTTEGFIKLFIPELKQLVGGDEKTWLIMAQLEYWFGIKSNGFYKFTTIPTGHSPAYKVGDSWIEEMGMSADKINSGLKPICTSYKSFSDYKNQEGDKFKGKCYLSYYHKPLHKTYYFRNHEKVNNLLASLSLEKTSKIFSPKYSNFGKGSNSVNGDWNSSSLGKEENSFHDELENAFLITETTTKITSKIEQREEEKSSLYEKEVITVEEENGIFVEVESVLPYNGNNCSSSSEVVLTAAVGRREASAFPADFQLTKQMIDWAKKNNPEFKTDDDVIKSVKKFVSHNQKNYKANWKTALETWLLHERVPKAVYPDKPSQMDEYRKLLGEDWYNSLLQNKN